MTQHVRAERRIPVPAADLWATVVRMSGMEEWYPDLIAASEVDETGNVPRRTCTMRDGGTLEERILLRDAARRTFVYAIDSHPHPARHVVGTIRLDDLGDGSSHVSWSAQMALDPAMAGQVTAMVAGMYEAGLESLDAHCCSRTG